MTKCLITSNTNTFRLEDCVNNGILEIQWYSNSFKDAQIGDKVYIVINNNHPTSHLKYIASIIELNHKFNDIKAYSKLPEFAHYREKFKKDFNKTLSKYGTYTTHTLRIEKN